MSDFVVWIAAEGAEQNPLANPAGPNVMSECESRKQRGASPEAQWKTLPAHNFPASVGKAQSQQKGQQERALERDPDLWLYRSKTVSLLRRYMRWSLEAGRVPSLLGRELFRSRVSYYSATTFESRVLFLHDVETCLDRLDEFDRQMVGRIILQEHSHEAAARLLHCTRKTLERRLPDLLDDLSDAFLRAELLVPFPQTHEEPL
jgi:DNA-directed RNA polymerase specialized sigma24 family protein